MGFGFLRCGCGCEVRICGVAMENEILIWVRLERELEIRERAMNGEED